MGSGCFPGVKRGRRVTLTPHPLLVPWSRKSRAIPLLLLWAGRPVQSYSACTVQLYLYSPYGPYGLYRASVPVKGCSLPFKSTFVGKRYATTVTDLCPPPSENKSPPFYIFIAMGKLVLNYTRSSGSYPSHKMLSHCTLNTVVWNNSCKSVCNVTLHVFNKYRGLSAIKCSWWDTRWGERGGGSYIYGGPPPPHSCTPASN